jgi:hypothetical protein
LCFLNIRRVKFGPTTTNDAHETNESADPHMPIDSQTASTKKVGRPSLADKAAQAKAEANIQKAVTDAINAFARMKTADRAVGKKPPDGGLLQRRPMTSPPLSQSIQTTSSTP